ncbi:hypothetical protein [Paenibacillus sp. Soil522]|uniref:hypothetical protein n=1 Tax=Paenibacillus sp. Soil522 TaxID=1736388 RepID=UPI0012DE36A2|nr:hypothetical protein [Paenibacillus sp. Soil522]
MQTTYKIMRQLLVISAFLVVSTGCADTEPTLERTTKDEVLKLSIPQQFHELPFESGLGRAIVIFEESGADCIIYVKGLNPGERYTISLVVGLSSGVMFGPKENVKIRVGSLEDEVKFKPNPKGELFVSMRNPIRFFTAAKEELFFKIESENKKEIMKTVPFLLNK